MRIGARLCTSSFLPGSCNRTRTPIFEIKAGDYWARIGHGAGMINFDRSLFAGGEVPPDKALR
jgi:hypothetical protein